VGRTVEKRTVSIEKKGAGAVVEELYGGNLKYSVKGVGGTVVFQIIRD